MTNLLVTESLIRYLNGCGGRDSYQLWTPDGRPDVDAARALAERLRALLGEQLGVVASVEQSVNRVVLSLILETARI